LGHRGGGTLAPENTLAGLRTASHYGFQGVEFDAKLTRDGVAILLHDDTLDRTTNGGGFCNARFDRLVGQAEARGACGDAASRFAPSMEAAS
jgi:glycerophosphoryl diester phosphodiesterase